MKYHNHKSFLERAELIQDKRQKSHPISEVAFCQQLFTTHH